MGFIIASQLSSIGDDRFVDLRWKLKMPSARMLIGFAIFIVYLIAGAIIFSTVENPKEQSLIRELREFRKQFLITHQNCLTDAELEMLIRRVVEATNKGVVATRNVSAASSWSFGNAFFFAGTLISTVGYGHVSPLTNGGKAFTIVYALIGIPLTLTLLTALVERLKLPSIWFMGKLNERLGHLFQPSRIRVMHFAILFIFILIVMFLIPSAIFCAIEPNWSYLDAFYYCFISLTTIVYLLIGLCCMMLLLATLYDIPQLNLGSFFLLPAEEKSSNEPEKLHLASSGITGPKYTKHLDEDDVSLASTASQPANHDEKYYQQLVH